MISVFYSISQQERQPCREVLHLVDKGTPPHLIPPQAGGGAVMDTCPGKSCRVTT